MFEKILPFWKSINERAEKAVTQEMSGMLGMIRGSTGSAPTRGRAEVIATYNNGPWLRSVASKVSHSVATTQWRLYAQMSKPRARAMKIKDPIKRQVELDKLGSGDHYVKNRRAQLAYGAARKKILKDLRQSGELEEIDTHPMLETLNGGNDYMTGLVTSRLAQVYLDLLGEAPLLKERNNANMPVALWPLSPLWLEKIPTASDPRFKFKIGNTEQYFDRRDILWAVDPDPAAPYSRGSGVGATAGDELDIDEYASKFMKDFFFNNARPDIIVTAEGLQKADTDRLQNDWNNKNQGIWRRFRAHFMNKKVDVTTLTQDMSSLKTIELRKLQRDIIFQIWGVPPEIMGVIESSNRATIDGAGFIFATYVLLPRLELWRSYYQQGLVPDYDDRLIIDFDSPVPEDKEHQLNVLKAAPYAFEVDEIRDMADQPELEDERGRVFFVPFNMTPTPDYGLMTDQGQQPASTGSQTSEPPPEQPDQKSGKKQAVSRIVKVLDESQIKRIVGEVKAQALFDQLEAEVKDTLNHFGQETINTLGINQAFSLTAPAVKEFIDVGTFNHLSTTINRTTINNLRKELSDSIAAGESIVGITARINGVFNDATNHRARTIARSESVRVANFGTVEAMHQARVPRKQWLSTRDTHVRDTHHALDGQIVNVNALFHSPSGAAGQHPGAMGTAAEDVNCRCTVLAVGHTQQRDYTEQQKYQLWKNFEAQRAPFERKFTSRIRRAFDQQRRAVMQKLDEIIGG